MTNSEGRAPAVLVIAGSDPSGGAGLQGDLASLAALGVYGMAVPSALTVQGPGGVRSVQSLPPAFTARSIATLLDSLPVDAVKIGMLHDATTARAVARALRGFAGPVVLDPVLRPSRGRSLAARDLLDALLDTLWPRLSLATPNLPEAAQLCGLPLIDLEHSLAAAQALQQLGCDAVLLKGGHAVGDPVDLLVDDAGAMMICGPRHLTPRCHGTGCALSTAIAAGLAAGRPLRQACVDARLAMDRALGSDPPVGRGTGAIAHTALRFSVG